MPDPLDRTPRLRLIVALLSALAFVVALATAGAAQEPEALYPEAAGTTVIHSEGIVGITLELPEPARLFTDDLQVDVGEETGFSWTGFRVDATPERWWCDFCFTNFTEYYPEFDRDPSYASCYDDPGNEIGCTYEAGLLELYLVSDGPITLTISFRNLTGSREFTATAAVDGAVQQLPVKGCDELPDGSCGVTYGGVSREIGLDGRPAMGWVIGYAEAQTGPGGITITPGSRDFEVCAYPSSLFGHSGSGDPADHPRGCDDEATPNVLLTASSVKKGDVNWKIHGQQYLGFSVWNKYLFDDAITGFWGMWLEAGMACPSLDFTDCNQGV